MKFRYSFALFLLMIPATRTLAAERATRSTAEQMRGAAAGFLALLNEQETSLAVMPFNDPRRLDWHNIPKPQRKGLQLADMSTAQRDACQELLKTALSDSGYEKVQRILSLENNLKEGEKHLANGHVRDPERYFLTIFGKPDASAPWGWSFEGHHLSLNFSVDGGVIVSDTPSFWGANPATVHDFVQGGPRPGTRTLADEEQLAFQLLDSLDQSQRAVAVRADAAPQDYRAAGKPQPPHTAPEGLAAAKMTEQQRNLLRKVIVAYCEHLAPELARARLADIERHGLERVHLAWFGAQRPGAGHAYRIQGPSFVLEFVNVQSDPAGRPANHIHSVWRSLEGDFGIPAN